MKKLILLAVLLLGLTISYGQDKGFAVMVFNLKTSMDANTPNEAYGSEWAYVVEDSTMYIWSRTDSVWNRYSGIDVTVLATSTDTSSIADPVIGDFAYIASDTSYIRGPTSWLFNSGGSGTTDLTAVYDSLSNPIIIFDEHSITLAGCETQRNHYFYATIVDDSIRVGDDVSTLIDETGEGWTQLSVTEWDGFAVAEYFAANLTAGAYSPVFTYKGVETSTVFNVEPGLPDTTLTIIQDSIFIKSLCGTEISRDTIDVQHFFSTVSSDEVIDTLVQYTICKDTCDFTTFNQAFEFISSKHITYDSTGVASVVLKIVTNGDGTPMDFTENTLIEGGDYSLVTVTSDTANHTFSGSTYFLGFANCIPPRIEYINVTSSNANTFGVFLHNSPFAIIDNINIDSFRIALYCINATNLRVSNSRLWNGRGLNATNVWLEFTSAYFSDCNFSNADEGLLRMIRNSSVQSLRDTFFLDAGQTRIFRGLDGFINLQSDTIDGGFINRTNTTEINQALMFIASGVGVEDFGIGVMNPDGLMITGQTDEAFFMEADSITAKPDGSLVRYYTNTDDAAGEGGLMISDGDTTYYSIPSISATPADGEGLAYNATTGRYDPVTLGGGGISGLTTNTIPVATSSTTLGDSWLSQSGASALVLAANKLLGLNEPSPDYPLHITTTGTDAWIKLERTDNSTTAAGIEYRGSDSKWENYFDRSLTLDFYWDYNGVNKMKLENDGKLTLAGALAFSGNLNIGGSFTIGSGVNVLDPYDATTGSMQFELGLTISDFEFFNSSGTEVLTIDGVTGKLGAGNITNPTGFLHAAASTTSTSALRLEEGVSQSTKQDGAINHVSDNILFTSGTTDYTLAKTLIATSALDFSSTSAQNSADLTITVTGASDGDAVSLGVPNAAVNANTSFSAWVSAADTVTVRFNNYSSGAVDPASGTFRVAVLKY